MEDVKMTSVQFALLLESLSEHVKWDTGGMFGDGTDMVDRAGLARAKRILNMFSFRY